MKLLYDVTNNKWYNENGDSFSSETPAIPYGNAERIFIQLYSEVKGINSGSEAVADWTKYTGFTGSGYGAVLATDNNFLHWYKTKLATNLGAGAIAAGTQIDVTTTESVNSISETGNIYLYDNNGNNEAIAYSSREEITGGIRFVAADGNVLDNSYAVNSQTDIPEMLYAEAIMLQEESDPATGLFVFDFVCDSTKLRNKMQYSSLEKVDDCKGLEITIFQSEENNILSIRKRFRCPTFRITGGIADIRSGNPMSSQEKNMFLAIINSVLDGRGDVQNLICSSAVAPTIARIGEKYFNTSDNKIHICTGGSTESIAAVWDDGNTPQTGILYFDINDHVLYAWYNGNMVNMCDASGEVSTHNAANNAHSSLFAATAKHADTIPTAAASLVGQTFIYTGITSDSFTNGHTYQCKENSGAYSWVDLTPAPDLTGVARSIDTLPTAGASYAEQVYIYTGTTSGNYKHGHLYQCKLIDGSYAWIDVQTGLYMVGNLSGIKCFVIGGIVSIKWSDPDDTKIGDVTVAKWGKTVLVRKTGDYPSSVDDGTVLVSSTVRDTYKNTAFQESLPEGETYYYRFFIYTDDGVLNDDPVNEAITGELTWASILDMCADPSIDMRDVFSAGDVLTAANSIRPTDGHGNFEWQVTEVAHDTFNLAAYKAFTNLQFDAPQKAYGLTADTVFASWKLLSLTGYSAVQGTYFLTDESATGTDRVWRRRNATYEVRYSGGKWIVFNYTNSTTAASQSTASADPWDGVWSNSLVVAKGKKYYTTSDGIAYVEAEVTDGDAVTPNTYYEPNPHNDRVNYGSNDYEGSPIDQFLCSDAPAGTYLHNNTIWSNPPSWASQQAGFLRGFDPDFLAAVKDSTIPLNLNNVTAGGGQKNITRKFYLLSATEVGLASGEGTKLEYYNGVEDTVRIKYNLSGGAQHWWLRSPYVGLSDYVSYVNSSGVLNNYLAISALGVVPACRIGENQ